MRLLLSTLACVCLIFLYGCNEKPALKTRIQGKPIGVLSVAWNPRVRIEGIATPVTLSPRHTAAMTEALLKGLAKLSNSWVRDANSVVLQSALTFYPNADPPKRDGLSLSLIPGYKWVEISHERVALHWCESLNVDTILTLILLPKAVFSGQQVSASLEAIVTMFNRQDKTLYTDTLTLPLPMSTTDQAWVAGDATRLPDVLAGAETLTSLSHVSFPQK